VILVGLTALYDKSKVAYISCHMRDNPNQDNLQTNPKRKLKKMKIIWAKQ